MPLRTTPTLPAYGGCPACHHRRRYRINPTCPVCQGAGVIVLGRGSRTVDPEAALEAVELALEQAATHHLNNNPIGDALRTGINVLAATMRRMTGHHLTAEPTVEATVAVILHRHRAGQLTRAQLTQIAQLVQAEARNPQPAPNQQQQNRRPHPTPTKPSPQPTPQIN